MKKSIILILLSSLSIFSLWADEYPPKGWTSNILEAIDEAQKNDKEILINFTGADWCTWCQKLDKAVFSQDEFLKEAEKKYVLLFLDFPQKRQLDKKTTQNNQIMASLFGVQGFPTIWLVDKNLIPLLKTGYRPGGPKEFLNHLATDRVEIDEAQKKQISQQLQDQIKTHIGDWTS